MQHGGEQEAGRTDEQHGSHRPEADRRDDARDPSCHGRVMPRRWPMQPRSKVGVLPRSRPEPCVRGATRVKTTPTGRPTGPTGARSLVETSVPNRGFRTLVEGLPAVVYVADPQRGDTHYVSPWLESITGQAPQDWMDDTGGWLRAIHPDDRDGVVSLLASAAERGEPFAAEYRLVTNDGRTKRVRDEAVLDLTDGSWHGWIVDITERAREDARLEFLAFHDPVTGLANGAFFEQHLSLELGRARRSGERLIVCSIDLDRFKLVNDTLGHAAGDA